MSGCYFDFMTTAILLSLFFPSLYIVDHHISEPLISETPDYLNSLVEVVNDIINFSVCLIEEYELPY